jgi:hypothetical protein
VIPNRSTRPGSLKLPKSSTCKFFPHSNALDETCPSRTSETMRNSKRWQRAEGAAFKRFWPNSLPGFPINVAVSRALDCEITAGQHESLVRTKAAEKRGKYQGLRDSHRSWLNETGCQFQLPQDMQEPGNLAKADIRRGGICPVDSSCGRL